MSGSDDLGGLGDLDEGGDDFGGLDEGEDLGGLDDDGFGDMEDGDEMAGGGGNVDELEHRLDELENEVGSLSSTVNTVRNENEQISNSVEEVEENVRKLLDIYEMVTRGVNPFADEMDAGMGMGGGQMEAQDSSFGLFSDDEQEEEETVDEDITEADAEGFFDDDLVDNENEAPSEMDEEIDAEMDDVFDEEGKEASESESDAFNETESEAFDDAADEFDEIAEDGFEDAGEVDDETAEEGGLGGDDIADDELFDETIEDEPAQAASSVQTDDADVAPEQMETVEERRQEGNTPDTQSETGPGTDTVSESAGKPYLASVPDGITGNLVILEWLEYLVSEVGVRGASEAIDYYETIDWVTEPVAAELESHLGEFDHGRRGSLSIDQHKQSLEFIDQLNGGDASTQRAAGFRGGEPL